MARLRVDRRHFTKLMAVGGASFLQSPWTALMADDLGLAGAMRRQGFGDPDRAGPPTDWGRLRFRCVNNDTTDWSVHPHGDLNLIRKINDHAKLRIEQRWNVADIGDLKAMGKLPMLFMHAENTVAITEAERKNLREYLLRGGFLYAEDCVNGKMHHGMGHGNWDFFFRSMSEVLRDLVDGAEFKKLPLDHDLFHCFFDLPKGQPHMQGNEHGGWGLIHKGRLLAYLSPSDCHCAWTNASWFGEDKAKAAVRMGTNAYVYAMTH